MTLPREISLTLKLDEGFLRRQCPNCRREFKWQYSKQGQSPYPAQGDYHCPYCGQQADNWRTEAQRRYMTKAVAREAKEAIRGALRKTAREVNRPGGMVTIKVSRPEPKPSGPREPHDMRPVEPPCHPLEPIKIAEDWADTIHCLICGEPFTPAN